MASPLPAALDSRLRMDCLQLAAQSDRNNPVPLAKRLYAFAVGEADGTVRERVAAILDDANVT